MHEKVLIGRSRLCAAVEKEKKLKGRKEGRKEGKKRREGKKCGARRREESKWEKMDGRMKKPTSTHDTSRGGGERSRSSTDKTKERTE